MAGGKKLETLQTKDHDKVRAACEAMHLGRDVTINLSGMNFTGQVMAIRRMADFQFQITLRIAA